MPLSSRLASSLFAFLLFLSLAPLSAAAAEAPRPPLPVVATFSILADVVHQIAGPRVALTTLVGPDGDAHTYEPTPADATAVARAAIIFSNGLGLEPWLLKLADASASTAVRVVTTSAVKPRTLVEEGHEQTDPHCWQNVENVILIAQSVRDALIKADPPSAPFYTANADAYIHQLRDLDGYIRKQTDSLPKDARKLVTSHDALGYFAQRYDYTVIGQAMASLSTEGAEPSAQEVADIIQEIRRAHVPAVFTENIHNPKLMKQIAADTGVNIVTSLYTDALGPEGTPGATYVGMMRSNIDAIVKALKP